VPSRLGGTLDLAQLLLKFDCEAEPLKGPLADLNPQVDARKVRGRPRGRSQLVVELLQLAFKGQEMGTKDLIHGGTILCGCGRGEWSAVD